MWMCFWRLCYSGVSGGDVDVFLDVVVLEACDIGKLVEVMRMGFWRLCYWGVSGGDEDVFLEVVLLGS
ncbi:hypothetical protein scyTo_0024840 [Scyliorhinus torazame]|uniref:Transmembrane protein n=1 Tax=Scyliorhinus torazame TaxID=75743 RepID=A0A401QF86_SCYTO|nr:hypothetical protein [Scyliorhinus torazame]